MNQGSGLTIRFLGAQVLVVAISLTVAAGVASLVGPPLFHNHLLMAGLDDPSLKQMHAEQAYQQANAITLTVSLPTALLCALVASLWMSRRLRTPLRNLTKAATSIAEGNYHLKVPVGDTGPEVTALAQAFNTMADRLGRTEQVRRQLLSDLAHEMGTPLSVLIIYLDGLQDGIVEWNSTTHEIIAEQLQRLTRLIEDIDDVSRAQEQRIHLDLTQEKLDRLIHIAATTVQESFRVKGVVLNPTGVLSEAIVTVDRQRFGQVLSNLLTNALRHTPRGGKVTISTSIQGTSTIDINVADTGVGMTSEQLRHIFERFYRGDTARSRDHGGAGIGLTISRALMEAHGGTLTAASKGPGTGSVFTLRLPLLEDGEFIGSNDD